MNEYQDVVTIVITCYCVCLDLLNTKPLCSISSHVKLSAVGVGQMISLISIYVPMLLAADISYERMS